MYQVLLPKVSRSFSSMKQLPHSLGALLFEIPLLELIPLVTVLVSSL